MIVIDYSDKRPIYEQIVDRFRTLILNGVLETDEKLPSVRSLAIDLAINPNTIQRAYTELERSGFIYSVKGRGNFVRSDTAMVEVEKQKLLADLREHACLCRGAGISIDAVKNIVKSVYEEV